MEIHKYNRLKAASKRVQSEVSFDSAEWEQARPQVKIVDQPLGPLGRFQRKKVQPSVEQLYEIERHLDVDVKELLVSSK